MWFEAFLVPTAVIAGGLAAVTGFGIGSLLTPILAWQVDTRLAVAAVSVPHVIGTALRFWRLKGGVDRRLDPSQQAKLVLARPGRQSGRRGSGVRQAMVC